MWGAISWWGKSELYFIDGNLNADRYIHDVLAPVLLPFYRRHPRHAHFLQDNAPPHRAFATRDWLTAHNIDLLDRPWPAKSPDLNSIENLWGIMGTNIRSSLNPPTNLEEIQDALREEWAAILLQLIRRMILSRLRVVTLSIDRLNYS